MSADRDAYERQVAEGRRRRAEDEALGLALFAPLESPAPHNNTATSIAAAESVAGQLQRLELLVLRAVIGSNGATSEELEDMLSPTMTGNSIRPRIVALREKGYVRELLVTRATRSGRQAAVHVATPAGFEAAAQANGGYANVTDAAA